MHFEFTRLAILLSVVLGISVQGKAPPPAEVDIQVNSPAGDEATNIVNLTTQNFDDIVYDSKSKLVFVEFYAPWCGHCKELAPEYERAAVNPDLKDVTFAKIDCDSHGKPCEKLEIKGYPTMLLFKRGEKAPKSYDKGRTADEIAKFISSELRLPFTSIFTKEDLDHELKKHPKASVVYLDSPEVRVLLEVAEKTRQEAPVLVVFNSELSAKAKEGAKSTSPMYLEFHHNESKKVFTGEVTADSFEKFIRNASIPLLAEIGPENYMSYVGTGLPIGFCFYEGSAMREKYAPILTEVAPEFKEHVNFVFIDAAKYKGYASALNVTPKSGKQDIEWPIFVIHNLSNETKFVCDEAELTKESLTKFMSSYVANSLKPSFKSQDPPKENNDPVKVIVHTTFDEIAMDKSKDVLVDLYAPWCGMCKRIEPHYEQLAKLLGNDSGVVLAKMDATLNDIPSTVAFKLDHYPTLLLFKANTNEMVVCDSFLDIKALHDFLKTNATNNKFNIEAEVAKAMAEAAAKTPSGTPEVQDDEEHEDEIEVEEDNREEL